MSRKTTIIALLASLWLGFALRLHNLDVVPLRGDEAFSAMFWAEMPLSQSLTEIATTEPHPPLTYVIFHFWNLIVGGINSPFTLRMLSVLGNLIGIPAIYALGKHLTGKRTIGLFAAWMWTIHPFEIWHAQDFRNYALWAGLSVTSLWLGVRLIRYQRRVDWGFYIVFALVTALTFYTELLTIIVLGLYVVLFSKSSASNKGQIITPIAQRLFVIQATIVAIVLIGFIVLQGSLLSSGGYGGNVEPFYAPSYLTRFIPSLTFGDTIPIFLQGIWMPLAGIFIIFTFFSYRNYPKATPLLILLGTIPLILLGIVSTRISIFHPRYVIATVPAFILILVLGADIIGSFLSKRLIGSETLYATLILLPWFIISGLTLDNYFNNPALGKSPAWDELGEFLKDEVTTDDLVIQLSSDPAFGYYYQGQADDIGLPSNPFQPETDIIATLESAQSQYDSLYIVSNAIPDWQNADVIETWANQNMQLVRLSSASGLGIRQYKDWKLSDNYADSSIVRFDDLVELVDYQLFDQPLPTGEIVVWLYWKPLSQTDSRLKSFVHLVGDMNPATGSPLWSQDDQFPQEGKLTSTSWQRGSVYRDVYFLSADELQLGNYQILLGWYDPDTDQRVNTNNNQDTFHLATLSK